MHHVATLHQTSNIRHGSMLVKSRSECNLTSQTHITAVNLKAVSFRLIMSMGCSSPISNVSVLFSHAISNPLQFPNTDLFTLHIWWREGGVESSGTNSPQEGLCFME